MKYERLTERDTKGFAVYKRKCNSDNIGENLYIQGMREEEVLNRLAELEDKIEQGVMVELPCKVGDTVYQVCQKPNIHCFVERKKEFFIMERKVEDIKISMAVSKPLFRITTICKEIGIEVWSGEHINTHLFLTREEAEKRLKELQE